MTEISSNQPLKMIIKLFLTVHAIKMLINIITASAISNLRIIRTYQMNLLNSINKLSKHPQMN